MPTQGQWQEAEQIVLMHEFRAGLQRYFTTYQAPVRTLDDVIAWNRQHAGKELALFDQDLMDTAATMGGLGTPAYIRARSDARRLAKLRFQRSYDQYARHVRTRDRTSRFRSW